MAEAGHVTLIIAFLGAIFSAISSIVGSLIDSKRLITFARIGILGIFSMYTLALVLILYAFISKDFSLKIVAEHSSLSLSSIYTISALYADKAGSMFFWGWLMALFSALLILQTRANQQRSTPYSVAILLVVVAFFLYLVTFNVNIFAKQPLVMTDGFGLNPLLQNFGMLLHPPLLYMGFAGFAIVFSLTMASLITNSNNKEQNNLIRHWTLFSWGTLGIGNIVGMWWSYNELGWGGYWAWDPVENAGLMPWLLGTAFLHSWVIRRQKNHFKLWSYNLIIFTFVFTLLSPFITHGGIESPLHGFYGSSFPPYILAAMIIVIIGSLSLLCIHRQDLKDNKEMYSLISREGSFLLTNILLVLLVLVIFIGTIMPGVATVFGENKIALDRSFFDRSCGPIMLLLVFLMGICPILGSGKIVWNSSWRNVTLFIFVLLIACVAILISGIGNWYIAVVILCGLPLYVISQEWARGTIARRRLKSVNCVKAFYSLFTTNRARYGGFLSHIGIVLIALGIIVSSFYSVEKMEKVNIGESLDIGSYKLSYTEMIFKQDNSKISAVASIEVHKNGKTAAVLHPSYAYWFDFDDFFAEVAVRSTPIEDLFVSLIWTGFDPVDKSATFRVLINPLIVWIWTGGGFFLLGGFLSFSFTEKQLNNVEK